MIRHLPADVKACIRTGFALTSFAQTVEELVLNGVDAGASSIAVRVDFSCFKIQVVDNGFGISLDQFQLIGERYSTSKCHKIEDLENLKYFGYRGEALASIRTAASFLEIVSRSKTSAITYSKCFQNGNALNIIQASQSRPSSGTTVTAHDLFYNLPVRRKRLNGALELEKIRYRLAGIALMWPQISFSLRDDSVGHVILQTYKCSGMVASFSYIFTPARARGLMEVSAERDEFKLTGFVSKECYSRMDLQFVFVNKRLVLKSSIHRQINKIIGRSQILRRKGLTCEVSEKNVNAEGPNTGSPQKQWDKYAIFAINVQCPYNVYDITFDPSKTLVEFKDWPKLIHLLQDMLYGFLRKENLLSNTEPASSVTPDYINDENDDDDDDDEEEEDGCQTIANFDNDVLLQNENVKVNSSQEIVHKFGKMSSVIENGLFSKPVHRSKTLNSKSLLVSPEPVIDHSRKHQTDVAAQNVKEQSDEKDLFKFPVLDPFTSGNAKNESHQLRSSQENYGNNFKRLDLESDRKSADHIIKKSLLSCTFSSENKLPSAESLTLTNIQNKNEDSEEIFIKGQALFEKREITLGNSVHYSSTLKSLRDIRQTSSSSCVSEIITNTLQQLRQSTQKAAKSFENPYKTPEKLSSINEDKPSPTKQPKMDDNVKTNSELNEIKPVSEKFISSCTGKLKKVFPCNIIEHSDGSSNQIETKDVVESNVTICGQSSSSTVAYKSTQEDRSLGQNDRGSSLKRTLDDKISHASKLAKLMRGENIQENRVRNDDVSGSLKHAGVLNAFSYSRSVGNVHSKHPLAHASASISNKSFKNHSQITDNSSEDMFLQPVNKSQDYMSNNEEKTTDSSIDLKKMDEHASSKAHTLCSAASYRKCFCTLCQTREQLNHAGDDLPFRIYRSAEDVEQYIENEVDKSPKVSVVLSLPLENVGSKICHSETWDRPETTRPVLLSSVNTYDEALVKDVGQIIKPEPKFRISGTSFSIQTLDITSDHSCVKRTTKNMICQSVADTEQKHEVPCMTTESWHPSRSSELEATCFRSNNEISEMSQGFTIQLNNADDGTSLEIDNSPLVIHSTDSLSSFGESASGFESAGFSPTSNVTFPTDEELSPNTQSDNGQILTQCAKSKIIDSSLGTTTNQAVFFNSDIHTSNIREREPRDKSNDVLCVGTFLSVESDSDIHIGNNVKDIQIGNSVKVTEPPYSELGKMTFCGVPVNIDTGIDSIRTNSSKECLRHTATVLESVSVKEISNEPIILVCDSMNSFSTVPETDDTESYNLKKMKTSDVDNDLKPIAGALRKNDSEYSINSHSNTGDNNLIEVKSMIANAKHIFKNMKTCLGISDSSLDLFSDSLSEKKSASVLENKHTLGHNEKNVHYSRYVTETNACSHLGKSENSSRTFIDHTNDYDLILLHRSSEENILQGSLNVSGTSNNSNSIPCGQRIENNDIYQCSDSSLVDSHKSDQSCKETGQTVFDNYLIHPSESSSHGHLEMAICLTDPKSSHTLQNVDENERHYSQIPIKFAYSEDGETYFRGKNNSEFSERNRESQIYNSCKQINILNSENFLQEQIESRSLHYSGGKVISSQTDIMSLEGDQVLMMIEEPVQSSTILSQESQIHEAVNKVDENDKSYEKSLNFSARREKNFTGDSELRSNSVTNNAAQKDEAGENDSSHKVKSCIVHPNSNIGLSNSSEALTSGPTSHGLVTPNIVSSSLSLLRPSGLPMASDKVSSFKGEQLIKRNISSDNVDLFYNIESTLSKCTSLSVASEASNSEKVVSEVNNCISEKFNVEIEIADSEKTVKELRIKMAEATTTTCELVHNSESLSNQKYAESKEEIPITACWKAVTDPETGQQTYVNNHSGHTLSEDQWVQMPEEIQREMLTVPSEKDDVNDTQASGPAVFSDSQKQEFTDLVTDHFEKGVNEAMSKWRNGERPTYDKSTEVDVTTLMTEWKNPVFLNYKQPGLLTDVCPSGTVARSCFNSLSSVEFNKNMLNNLKVIGQLDNKFIVCVIDTFPVITKAVSSLLVLFDQHAVHERIRLEQFTRDVYEVENGERTDRIKRSKVKPAQSITMDQDDLRIMKAFHQEFDRIGVSFSVDKVSREVVHINCFPSCLVDRDASEMKRNKIAGVIENVEILIKEHIELLKSTNGACGRLPLAIHKVLCSQACHGAVKFGDKLMLQECQDLISLLASCSLPFQCAHGRPSIAPLVNLSALEKELSSTKRRPNLRKITENLNK